MDRSLQREVAIKEIVDDRLTHLDKRLLARFLNEARITGQLQHPGIVPVYQIGAKENGGLFYVMKYVRGRTLEEAIKKANENKDPNIALKERLALIGVLIDVCDAMGYAHDKKVIHRDLKPGNIVLGNHGENVILDWGLAKYYEKDNPNDTLRQQSTDLNETVIASPLSSEATNLTLDGEILGTPSYMAPEQVEPEFGSVDKQSDVYALGVILFQILTGKLPYKANSVKSLLRMLTSNDPSPNPMDVLPDCPPELAMICRKAMSKKKEDRFVDASAMATELKAYRDGRMVSIYAYSRKELFKRFVRQHKALIAGGAIAVAAIVIGGIFSVHFGINAAISAKTAREAVEILPDLEDESLHKVMELSDQFNKYFTEVTDDLKAAAATIETEDVITSATVNPVLKTLLDKREVFEGFYYLQTDGLVIGAWPEKVFGTIGQNVADQEHFQIVCKTMKPHLSKLFKAIEGYNAVILDYPVIKDGKLVGILNGMIRPDVFLAQAFSEGGWNKNTGTYRAFVIEGETYRCLYDISDPQLHGENLLTTPKLNNQHSYKEYLKKHMAEDMGIGKYTMEYMLQESKKKKSPIIHRLTAWQTFKFSGTEWKISVATLFQEGVGVLRNK